jgi:hypothetical protein
VPAGPWQQWKEFFAESIKAFPGALSDDGRSWLALRLGLASYQAVATGKLGIKEADRKRLRAILEPTRRKLLPLMKRNPIIAQHVELPMWLTVPPRKIKEPHTVLLHGIFTAYEDTRQRYPDCKAPAVGLKVEFRKFLDAVLIDFGLGPTGDKIIEGELSGPGMIGEGELRGAWRRWLKARAV